MSGRSIQLHLGTLNEKQDKVMRLKKRYVAYGGARGGGKSWLLRFAAKYRSLAYPGCRQLIIRQTYPELYHNHIKTIVADTRDFARYNDTKKELTLKNGSVIVFGYCQNEKDMQRYQGQEYDFEYLDEAGNIPEICIQEFRATVRGTNDFPKRTMYTLNPGGKSHAYFRRVFVDRNFKSNENPDDYGFVQALPTDNKALMEANPDYIKDLEALPERLRLAWLEGRWDIVAGQFFDGFRTDPDDNDLWTHVIEPFEPRPEWKIIRSYDYGYNKPFAVTWWALSTDGVLYLILQMYGCTGEPNEGVKWTAEKQFQQIARVEREHPWLRGKTIQGIADPAIWIHESTGISIAETARRCGVRFDKGNNDRINGWAQCQNRLAFDTNGIPMMRVFSNCKHFIRTIPTLMVSETRPEDLDTEGQDHLADTWRYVAMANIIKPRIQQVQKIVVPGMDPLELSILNKRNRRR